MDQLKNPESRKEDRNQVVELGSDITRSEKGNIYTLTIIGQVEGHQVLPETAKTTKYEHVLPLLAGIEESEEIDGLLLLLNTVGGDIEAGLAIAEMIAGMKKPTVSLVLGGGHSIGIPLAVCTKKSFITPTASSPSKNDRPCGRRTSNFSLFSTNSGTNSGFCYGKLRDLEGTV